MGGRNACRRIATAWISRLLRVINNFGAWQRSLRGKRTDEHKAYAAVDGFAVGRVAVEYLRWQGVEVSGWPATGDNEAATHARASAMTGLCGGGIGVADEREQGAEP